MTAMDIHMNISLSNNARPSLINKESKNKNPGPHEKEKKPEE
jgi:hypothetical protein